MIYESFSENETRRIAMELASTAVAGEIYALSGELGVGKTVFVKGFAAGLGVVETLTSPTFTIFKEYHSGRLPLYHMDAYRISNIDDMFDIGYEEYFFGDGVCLVEWAELAGGLIPYGDEGVIRIRLEKDLNRHDDFRRIDIVNIPQRKA